jgi:hypothetical protein
VRGEHPASKASRGSASGLALVASGAKVAGPMSKQGPAPCQRPPTPSDIALRAPESGIVDIMNYGRRKGGVMPLWAGEGDLPTPDFIAEAATASLAEGETFYTWQRGLPELARRPLPITRSG